LLVQHELGEECWCWIGRGLLREWSSTQAAKGRDSRSSC
jgi:hypothetical protein